MDKFTQYNLNLTDKNKGLVTSYLQNIKKFVEKNNIEKELYNDIEEMVFEKLSNAKSLNQLTITKILKEVGEPEVIFSDYIDSIPFSENNKVKNKEKKALKVEKDNDNYSTEEENNEKFYENMIKTGWQRDNKKAVFLGLSSMLAGKMKLATWMVRVLFVIFAFFGGLGVYIYVILGIILPIKGINYEGKTTFGYFKTQLYYFIKDLLYNTINSLRTFIRRSIKKIYNIIKYILNFTMKHIIPILRFITFATLGLILASIFLAGIIVGSAYFSSFTFDNIDFAMILPSYFLWFVVTGIFSVGVFMVACFVFSVNGKWINKYLLSGAFVSFVIALFLGFSTIFHVTQLYSKTNIFSQEIEIQIDNNNNKDIVLDIYDIVNPDDFVSFINYNGTTSIELVNEKSNILRFEVKYNFLGNEEIANKIKQNFGDLKYTQSNSLIKIEKENTKNNKIPPAPLHRDIVIFVPEGYTLKFNNYAPYFFYVSNAHLSSEYEKYSDFIHTNCSDKKMWYSENEERFICNLSDSQIKAAQEGYLRKYVILNFDKISPLLHKNEFKRSYRNDGGFYSDWDFKNFYWGEDNKLNIEFSDMSLDIRASMIIRENGNIIEVSDFKINNVQVEDYIFKTKYYEDITPIQDYIKNVRIEEDNNGEYYDDDEDDYRYNY